MLASGVARNSGRSRAALQTPPMETPSFAAEGTIVALLRRESENKRDKRVKWSGMSERKRERDPQTGAPSELPS